MLIEHERSVTDTRPKTKKVSVKRHSTLVGDVIGINGYRVNLPLLKQRFSEGGYHLFETAHFLVFTRVEPPSPVVVHWFAPELLDANLGYYLLQELKPSGFLTSAQNFANVYGAIVESLAPYNPQSWYVYTTNTLQRYRHLLAEPRAVSSREFPIDTFAELYRRVCELQVGQRFLDVGCSTGYLPLLLAERVSSFVEVVGVDINPKPFSIARRIAEENNLSNVRFVQADLLSDTFSSIGQFDTVMTIHVIEHFTEQEMYRALIHLLEVTSQRLILIVPFEESEPERVYEHKQLFTRAKLEAVGRWCLRQWGSGTMHYEDSADGLLLLERAPQTNLTFTSIKR